MNKILITIDAQGRETISTTNGVIKTLNGCTYVIADTIASARQQLQELQCDSDDWKRYRQEFGVSRYF